MKIIGFETMEGGIVLHGPSGKRKVCPISDDHDAVAIALGGLVVEILMDSKEPEAVTKPAVRDEDDGDEDDDDEEEEEERPRRRRKKKRRAGENADGYVNRVGREAGVSALRGLWRGLQRMSGTEVED